MRIRIEGPFETSFSFSLLNRGLAGALARQPGVALGLRPSVPPGNGVTCRTTLASDDELAAFCRTAAARSADWVIRLVYPPVTDPPEDGARLAISFPWEETLVPGEWIEAMNREAHLVIALSEHVRRALRASGLALPIAVVWPGLDGDPGSRADAPAPLPTGKGFRFLHVSSGFPRKGCDVLLRAYTAEFTRAEDVCLLVKTLPQFDHDVAARIRRARLRRLRCPEIVHLDRDLDPAAMQALFRSASCLVHPARAEGFALPIAEAMRARVPVIATRWGGALDYCDEETATLIGGRLAPAASPTRVPGAEWFEPDERELRAAMRAHYERARSGTPDPRVTRAAERVATLTWDRAARATLAAVAGLEENGGAPIRAGMVSSWNVRCGLAEYSRAMIESQAEGTFAWTILAAEGERVREDGPEVVRCWREDEPATLAAAVEAALARRLDLVHFQLHLRQLGHPHAAAVARLREAGVRVFATLHSTREAPAAERFAAALGSSSTPPPTASCSSASGFAPASSCCRTASRDRRRPRRRGRAARSAGRCSRRSDSSARTRARSSSSTPSLASPGAVPRSACSR
jgi:O-antigen biosynthesis alpha-1,2-mannosyltransferase